jgi:TonB family protein
MARVVLVVLIAVLPVVAGGGDCTVDTTRMKPKLSSHALELRNALFLKACENTGGAFIDSTDPTLGKRLEPPRGLRLNNSASNYPVQERWMRHQGNVQLVFVIDTNGGVTDVTVIESSGHQLLDEVAVAMWSKARFDVSAKLDGQPIRSLAYSTVPFTLP